MYHNVSECLKSEGQVNLSRLSCTGCAGVRPEDVALINKINPEETPHTTHHTTPHIIPHIIPHTTPDTTIPHHILYHIPHHITYHIPHNTKHHTTHHTTYHITLSTTPHTTLGVVDTGNGAVRGWNNHDKPLTVLHASSKARSHPRPASPTCGERGHNTGSAVVQSVSSWSFTADLPTWGGVFWQLG